MSLKTDYQDAELSPSMGGKRRYNQIENADGTFSLEDRTAYTRLGDNFGAEDINATNREVNELNDSLISISNSEKIVSGTTASNVGGVTRVSYPNGWTHDKTMLLAREVLVNNNYYIEFSSVNPLQIVLTTEAIEVYVRSNDALNKPFRLLIKKII